MGLAPIKSRGVAGCQSRGSTDSGDSVAACPLGFEPEKLVADGARSTRRASLQPAPPGHWGSGLTSEARPWREAVRSLRLSPRAPHPCSQSSGRCDLGPPSRPRSLQEVRPLRDPTRASPASQASRVYLAPSPPGTRPPGAPRRAEGSDHPPALQRPLFSPAAPTLGVAPWPAGAGAGAADCPWGCRAARCCLAGCPG